MRPITLRSRITTLLLQWAALFVVAVGVVALLLYLDIRRDGVEEQMLLTQKSARYLDSALAGHFQSLQRITQVEAVDAELLARLRVFRFQSFFHHAIYVVDRDGAVLLSDPPRQRPAGGEFLLGREAITPLYAGTTGEDLRLAIVQPFHAAGLRHFVVSEMRPAESPINTILICSRRGSCMPSCSTRAATSSPTPRGAACYGATAPPRRRGATSSRGSRPCSTA